MANTNVPSFPFAAPSDAVLTVASDNAVTTLTSDIIAGDAAIPVADASIFAVPCLIVIDSEIILARASVGNTFTNCIRGFSGTTGASHSTGTSVYGYVLAYHHNQLAAEVKSVGSYIFNADLSGFKKNENLLTYSEDFSNGAWSKTSGVTVSSNVATLPNGATSFNLIEGNSSGMNKISATPTGLVAGQVYTMSVYAKYDSIRWLAIGQRLSGPENAVAWFDVENGVIGTVGSGATAVMVPLADGWYRCIVVVTCTANSYKAFDICLSTSDNSLTYLGTLTNKTIISAAQVKSGSIDGPMSYVKTSGQSFSLTGSGDLVLDEGDLS